MNILSTKHLMLRTWEDSDLASMLAINQDPLVMRYFPALQDKEYTRQFIKRMKRHQEQYGYALYAVVLKETG